VLTDVLNWHWIFLVNLPIGAAVFALSLKLLPAAREQGGGARLDVAGAVTVTASLVLAVYAIVNGNTVGWTSARTLGLLGAAAALLAAFLAVEARVAAPLVPACSGQPRCSRGSSCPRSISSSCSVTARSRSVSRSCRRT
jgi:MFS family permease